jgi:hypothetical protein
MGGPGSIFHRFGVSFWRPRAYFGVIFEVLEAPWGALGDLWVTFGSPWGPWGVQGRFFIDLGGSFWWPWGIIFGQKSCFGP